MPLMLLFWILLPVVLDVWLTVLIAQALSIKVWVVFVVPMLIGVVLLFREKQLVQEQWRALRQMQGSPLSLWGSARRAFAALLLVLPGLGSDCLAVFLLCLGLARQKRVVETQTFTYTGVFRQTEPDLGPNTSPKKGPEVIEGDYRRE